MSIITVLIIIIMETLITSVSKSITRKHIFQKNTGKMDIKLHQVDLLINSLMTEPLQTHMSVNNFFIITVHIAWH